MNGENAESFGVASTTRPGSNLEARSTSGPETGRKNPGEARASTLDAICRELDCQPGDLLEYEE